MAERLEGRRFLFAAGALSAGMGLYHFWLPAQFGWAGALAHDRMLRWALMSINTFFSYLLFAAGAITIVIAARARPLDSTRVCALAGMIGFWLLNAAYQLLSPMPLPPRLAALRWLLLGFACLVLALYSIGLRRALRSHPE